MKLRNRNGGIGFLARCTSVGPASGSVSSRGGGVGLSIGYVTCHRSRSRSVLTEPQQQPTRLRVVRRHVVAPQCYRQPTLELFPLGPRSSYPTVRTQVEVRAILCHLRRCLAQCAHQFRRLCGMFSSICSRGQGRCDADLHPSRGLS
jgi:hypothetical protein